MGKEKRGKLSVGPVFVTEAKHHANVSGFQTLSAADLRDPKISGLAAAKLKEFNELDTPGPKNVRLWDRLRYGSFLSSPFTCLKREKVVGITIKRRLQILLSKM